MKTQAAIAREKRHAELEAAKAAGAPSGACEECVKLRNTLRLAQGDLFAVSANLTSEQSAHGKTKAELAKVQEALARVQSSGSGGGNQ